MGQKTTGILLIGIGVSLIIIYIVVSITITILDMSTTIFVFMIPGILSIILGFVYIKKQVSIQGRNED